MKARKQDTKGRYSGQTRLGREILSSLHDLQDTLEAGIPLPKKYKVDVVSIPEPGAYGAKEVQALRAGLGVSQPVFARLIGASTVLVQKWEQGQRNPDGMARRLMDHIAADPKRWLRGLGVHRKAG